uniref:Polysacc_synt_4 domain-containing protein n=1 Tax=Caenorhabditis tropicalis TaxID=1561998 RepID=A0A1I7UST3_9PELO
MSGIDTEIESEVHMNLIMRCDTRILRLNKNQDIILAAFRKSFPDLDVEEVTTSLLKDNGAKEIWREFCEQFKETVDDYSMGTLMRCHAAQSYSPENTVVVPRIIYLAVEMARNLEGVNEKNKEAYTANYKSLQAQCLVIKIKLFQFSDGPVWVNEYTGLFGATAATSASTVPLFGSTTTTSGLFGSKPATSTAPSGGLFGATTTTTASPATGELIGSKPAAATPPAGGLFGSSTDSSSFWRSIWSQTSDYFSANTWWRFIQIDEAQRDGSRNSQTQLTSQCTRKSSSNISENEFKSMT